jgi:CRISPR-associated endonuclease/helicase Cas3
VESKRGREFAMMFVCVCESSKKSLPKVRKILSKYFRQIGRRTWMGQLSEEGASDLQKELIKEVASRHTSVSCFKISKFNKGILHFHVGSKERLSESGEFAYSVTAGSKKENLRRKNEDQFLLSILRISALFHDLGKGSIGFQSKLISAVNVKKRYAEERRKDAIRHELVSCFILFGIFENYKDDVSLFQSLSSAENVKNIFAKNADTYLKNIRESIEKYSKTFIREPWPDFQEFMSSSESLEQKDRMISQFILWLVVSHHKLPEINDLKQCGGVKNLWRDDFYDKSKIFSIEQKEDIIQFLTLKETKKPWEDNGSSEGWCEQVATHFSFILRFLENNTDDLKFLGSYIPNFLRPLLVISDYMGSEKKQVFDESKENFTSQTFANTCDFGNGKKLADTIETHLKKVSYYSKFYFDRIFGYEAEEFFRVTKILKSKKSDQERFYWQHDIYNSISELRKKDKESPVFCVLTSSTGSGKTKGIALACSASAKGNQLRYSLGLGLRTLTLQTGNAYKNFFNERDIAVVVGDRLTRELWEEERENSDQIVDSENGTTNSAKILSDLDEANIIVGGQEYKGSWPCLSKVQERILSTPIVVATVDHFISGAEIRRGSESFMAMRLMTSDLALDEIDSYSAADLIPIGRLVYMAGLYGRNVVLASASVQKIIVQQLYEAFSMGVSDRLKYSQDKLKNIIVCFGSNYANISTAKILDSSNLNDFSNFYNQFLIGQILELKSSPERHFAEFIEVKNEKNCDIENFKVILKSAERMHIRHSSKMGDVKIQFSIGFVRWNRTHVCREFAKWLMKENEIQIEPTLAVFCYHSHMNFIDRRRVEYFLDNGLKRNELGEMKEFFMSKEFKKWHEINHYPQNIMMIVSTTSIQETGRDHDYDWAILDPCSTRSLVQSSGRVLRHRPNKLPSGSNIGILRFSSQSWFEKDKQEDKSKNAKSWAYPGIETDDDFLVPSHFGWRMKDPKGIINKNDGKIYEKYRKLEEFITSSGIHIEFPNNNVMRLLVDSEKSFYREITKKIDSSLCLIPPIQYIDSPMTSLEVVEFKKHLILEKISLREFVMNKKLRLGQRFFIKSRFRRNKNHFIKSNLPNTGLSKPKFPLEAEYYSLAPNEREWRVWLLKRAPGFPAHNNDFAIVSNPEEREITKNKRNFFYDFHLPDEVKEFNKILMKGNKNKNQQDKQEGEILKELSTIHIPEYWIDKKFYYSPIFGLGKKN